MKIQILFITILTLLASPSFSKEVRPTKSQVLSALRQAYFPYPGYPNIHKVSDLNKRLQRAIESTPIAQVGTCEIGLWNVAHAQDRDVVQFWLNGRKYFGVIDYYYGSVDGSRPERFADGAPLQPSDFKDPNSVYEASSGASYSAIHVFDAQAKLILRSRDKRELRKFDQAALYF